MQHQRRGWTTLSVIPAQAGTYFRDRHRPSRRCDEAGGRRATPAFFSMCFNRFRRTESAFQTGSDYDSSSWNLSKRPALPITAKVLTLCITAAISGPPLPRTPVPAKAMIAIIQPSPTPTFT